GIDAALALGRRALAGQAAVVVGDKAIAARLVAHDGRALQHALAGVAVGVRRAAAGLWLAHHVETRAIRRVGGRHGVRGAIAALRAGRCAVGRALALED